MKVPLSPAAASFYYNTEAVKGKDRRAVGHLITIVGGPSADYSRAKCGQGIPHIVYSASEGPNGPQSIFFIVRRAR